VAILYPAKCSFVDSKPARDRQTAMLTGSKISERELKNNKKAVLKKSRSSKVVDFGTN